MKETQNSNRRIYIPNTIVSELQALQQEQARLKAELGDAYTDFNLVIAQNNGRPYEEKRICELFHTFIEENKLPPVVFHSLRHSSAGIKLRSSGGDIKAVQGDTGHAQVGVLLDIYAHTTNDHRKELAHKMDELFFSPQEEKAVAPSTDDPYVKQMMQLLQEYPEIAEKALSYASFLQSQEST